MSAVSSLLPTPGSEPAAARRRAPEAGSGREPAPFSVPEGPAAEGGGEAKLAGPAQPVTAEGAVPASAQPKPDTGALIAIAEAKQATGEAGETAAKPRGEEAEGPIAADMDGDDAAAALPDPAALQGQPTPVPLVIEALPPPGVAGGEAASAMPAEVVTAAVEDAAGQGAPVVAIPPGAMPVPALPAAAGEVSGEIAGPASQVSAPTADIVPNMMIAARDATEAGLTPPEAAGAASAEAAGAPAKSSPGHAKAAKDGGGEAVGATLPTMAGAEAIKPVEAPPQPTPSPIDFSALLHSRAGRPEAVATPGPDQAAGAQSQLANGRRDAVDMPPTPLHVVPVEIGLRALAGAKRFDIRLDPAELGRVDVNLQISDKGEVSARLVVDRVETLHLLQRDARTLERAFEQAGLKPSDAGVDITLRDQGDQSGFRQPRQDEQAPRHGLAAPEPEGDDAAVSAQPVPIRRLVRLGGVDLSI